MESLKRSDSIIRFLIPNREVSEEKLTDRRMDKV